MILILNPSLNDLQRRSVVNQGSPFPFSTIDWLQARNLSTNTKTSNMSTESA